MRLRRLTANLGGAASGHRFLGNWLGCPDYPRALALDLPIGAGMIGNGHRHVLQNRLKKAGAAWLSDHGDQIARSGVLRADPSGSPYGIKLTRL